MKTLLLTDIPPTHSYTAGLVTAQMCRALNQDELVAFVIINKELDPKPAEDLASLTMSFALKPNEQAVRSLGKHDFGEIASFIHETKTRYGRTPELIEEAVKFGLKHDVEQVWAILQGQTMVRVSRRVAVKLDVPLKTQIWDPLSWWHQARGVDRVNRLLDNYEWKKTLKTSKIIASASPAMSEHITRNYGTPSIPIIAAVDKKHSYEAVQKLSTDDKLVIGMAGQFYAVESWTSLCEALNKCDWKVDGRDVYLKIMGGAPPPNSIPAENFEYLGWLDQSDVIRVLADSCDICYCPYPFASHMEEVSRLSFPSKIVIYLASGRPILFHGPSYSSPIRYIVDSNAGVCCDSLADTEIISTIRIFLDAPTYKQLSTSARAAFLRDFTMEKQSSLVREFLSLKTIDGSRAESKLRKRYRRMRTRDDNRRRLVSDAFDPWFYFDNSKHISVPGRDLLTDYIESGWKELRDPNHWFSVKYYLDTNSDVRERNLEPLSHYLEHGWREGRQPNSWFQPSYYLEKYHDVRDSGMEPFQHYLKYGQHEFRNPTPWFSTKYYVSRSKTFEGSGLDPLTHYFRHGWRDGISPSPWFSSTWYLNSYPDARNRDMEPWLHYLTFGSLQALDPAPWFSVAFYKSSNLDVPHDGVKPFAHYLSHGWREGRDPNSFFSTRHYLSQLREPVADDFEPCSHYFAVGWKEGFDPNPWFSTRYYLEANPDVATANLEPFSHYLTHGWLGGRDPNDWFSTRFYLASNPDLISSLREPVTHYLSEGRALGKTARPEPISFLDRCTSLAESLLTTSIKMIQDDMLNETHDPLKDKGPHFELIHSLSGAIHEWLTAVYNKPDDG